MKVPTRIDTHMDMTGLPGYQFGCAVYRYLPYPEQGDLASRINLGVSIFRSKPTKPEAITFVRKNYLDLVARFGRADDCDFVKDYLDTISRTLNQCMDPDSGMKSVQLILANHHEVFRVSQIVSVQAATLSMAAQGLALTFLRSQNEFCPFIPTIDVQG
jgi:hypothetical protein